MMWVAFLSGMLVMAVIHVALSILSHARLCEALQEAEDRGYARARARFEAQKMGDPFFAEASKGKEVGP